jgi:hypothetical protein
LKEAQNDRKGNRSEKEAVKGDERQAAITANWDGVFRRIPGNHLHQLRSSPSATISSNAPDGKKWIATKVVEIKGKQVCWCLPVEVRTGEAIRVTVTKDNVFGLGTVFDSALYDSESKK